jgi:hypothetical protein
LARLTFQEPFKPFVHRWEQLTQAIENEQDETTKSHLNLLYNTLKAELKETIAAKDDFIINKVITYEHLWTIFQPGCTVHTVEYGRDCGVKFSQGQYIQHPRYGPCFQLTCQKIDWDGEKFGYSNETPLISGFVGTKPITELEAFPLEFHPEVVAITNKLVTRGKLFEHYHGYHYKSYKGTAIAMTPCGPVKVIVDSRIIIDRYAHGRFNPNQHGSLQPLKHGVINPKAVSNYRGDADEDEDEYEDEDDDCYGSDGYCDEYDDYGDRIQDSDAIKEKKMKRIPLTRDQLILCTPLIKGYALKTKKWLQFFVDAVTEIQWNNSAFESLVLPEDQKELILSFAESQIMYKTKFDDFVSGKGKGIIMLLSGVSNAYPYIEVFFNSISDSRCW